MLRLSILLRSLAHGLMGLLRVLLTCTIGLCAVVGALAVLEIFTPPNLPPVKVARHAYVSNQPYKTGEQLLAMTEAERWEQLQPALYMLDDVCPQVSSFVRDRYACGHLFFETRETGRLAAWWVLPRILEVDLCCLRYNDREIACTLAHEFRHSRQPLVRAVQVGLGSACGVNRRDMCEDEAIEFEAKVRRALRGER